MVGQTLTGFDAVLKDDYGPRIEEQLSLLNVLSDYIEEDESEDWTGRQKIFPITVGRNQGVGAGTEGGYLPTAGAMSYQDVKIPAKYNYGMIRLTEQVIKQSQSNKGAFARAMGQEMTGLTRSLANDRERQFFGAGNGVLCLTNGAQPLAATTSVAVDSPYGITPTTNGARFLNPGMEIAVIAAASSAVEATFTVSALISSSTVTINSTLAVTLSDNTRWVRSKNTNVPAGTDNNFNNEVMGLLGLVDDGTYVRTLHNIDRVTYPIFNAAVISSVGQLTLDVIQRGIDATDELGGGDFGTGGVFFCHHSVRREYLKLLQADRRYTGADLKTPDGGTRKAALKRGGEITYGDRPWRTAKHAPYGTLFGIQTKSVTRYILTRGEWADDDGSVLKWVPQQDIWQAFYRIFDNLSTERPNDGFRLDGITATVQVNHIY